MTYNGLKASKYTKTYQIGFSPINCTWKTPFSSSKIKFEISICYLLDQIVSNPALVSLRTWYDLHEVHLILAEEPRCSGLVNLLRQSWRERVGPLAAAAAAAFCPPLPPNPLLAGRSREMSQKGSIVVDTFRQACKKHQGQLFIHWMRVFPILCHPS